MLSVYEELGEVSRRAILLELRSGPRSVSDIVAATNLKQPNVSNHLSRMRLRGVVAATKVGRQVIYTLASGEIEAALNAAFAHSEDDAASLDLEILAKTYAKTAVQGDELGCQEIVDRALRSGISILSIFTDLLTPAMVIVGKWYQVEAINVAQEHMASSITERMLTRSVLTFGQAVGHGKVAVLGCAPNNWHLIGLRMVSDFLRITGWRTLFLGADVPIDCFMEVVRNHSPRLVLLSCSAEESLPETLSLIRAIAQYRGKRKDIHIGVGGMLAVEQAQLLIDAGADFTSDSLKTFAENQLPCVERAGSVGDI